ncbi:hypothetical protein GP2143_09815 [marine gamma proteobacterium HTCC2143]|uniref:Uncharacterized protein n=1 Tax=marine gamma proteobacterium HTCC2143 TaxID=247633 RepID=A0YFS9_9GAMM|nr:hypothetical protein GP2143_09815 [marine gamma proteobacterium HTCC2143]
MQYPPTVFFLWPLRHILEKMHYRFSEIIYLDRTSITRIRQLVACILALLDASNGILFRFAQGRALF